jgi:superoxide dismutase, Cu-Zn family
MRAFIAALAVSLMIVLGCSGPGTLPVTPATAPAPLPTPARQPAPPPAPPPSLRATATLHDLAGARVGTVSFIESYAGVIVSGTISGIGLGEHAIHIHEFGKCQPPFTTAGAHFNPRGTHHGFFSPDGGHLGDLPNIDTPAAGHLHFELLLPGVTLKGKNALLDVNGASIVVHASRDNYYTDPSGDSGARIACGVITLQ